MDFSKYCTSPLTRMAEARNGALKSAMLVFSVALVKSLVLVAVDWTFCHASTAFRPGSLFFRYVLVFHTFGGIKRFGCWYGYMC